MAPVITPIPDAPNFQMDSLDVSCNKMSLIPALTAGFLFPRRDVYTLVF